MANNKGNTVQNILLTIFFLVLFVALSYISYARWGMVGIISANILSFLFGEAYLVFLIFAIIYCFYRLIINKARPVEWKINIGFILLSILILLLQGVIHASITTFAGVNSYLKTAFPHLLKSEIYGYGAGLLGHIIYVIFSSLFAKEGTILLLIIGFFVSFALLIPNALYKSWFQHIKDDFAARKQQKAADKAERKAMRIAEKEAKLVAKKAEKDRHPFFSFLTSKAEKDASKTDFKETKPRQEMKRSSVFINLNSATNNSASKAMQSDVQNTAKALPPKKNESDKKQIVVSGSSEHYPLPPLSLLEKPENQRKTTINRTSAKLKGERILSLLENFGIHSTLIDTHIGPSVTKFEIKPDSSVKVAKILSLQDNIKMELAAKDIRIEAPIPGRNAVGIEIPNVESIPVYLSELMASLPESKRNAPLLFHLGKDLMGQGNYCELNKMPHLLIAGATGSGKSVCINTIIMSLIMRNYPDDMKMVLIDPKKVEFTPYHDLPHLLWPVITDVSLASNLLQRVVVIMDQRYDIFAEVGVKNIQGYNQYVLHHNEAQPQEGHLQKMPYLVVIIDELADMMALAGKEVELSIQRITQLARACGIHLIVATQRPSTDVITGIIKANIPSRISFAVASSIDSRTILDATGAERLLGNGDMLYFPQGESSPIRLQGAYVRDQEILAVTNYLKKQEKPDYDDTYFELLNEKKGNTETGGRPADRDELFDEVVAYITEAQKASTSLLQRRFGIGYNRAARLIDSLEEVGYIGPVNGSKPREVLLKKKDSESND